MSMRKNTGFPHPSQSPESTLPRSLPELNPPLIEYMSHHTFHLSLSSNAKTGKIYVSTTSGDTCPAACPFRHDNAGGCYAGSGPLALHWRKVSNGERGGNLESFAAQIRAIPEGSLWRHNQAGDLPGEGDAIDTHALAAIVEANRGRRGFTYTHKPVLGSGAQETSNRDAIANANANGFTVNLSGNTLSHADQLASLGIAPVCVVLPSDAPDTSYTPDGRKVIVCPAQQREGITCATCQLCQRGKRTVIVGFRAHGTSHRKASNVARGEG